MTEDNAHLDNWPETEDDLPPNTVLRSDAEEAVSGQLDLMVQETGPEDVLRMYHDLVDNKVTTVIDDMDDGAYYDLPKRTPHQRLKEHIIRSIQQWAVWYADNPDGEYCPRAVLQDILDSTRPTAEVNLSNEITLGPVAEGGAA